VSQLNIQPPSEHHRPASLDLSQGSATGTRMSRSMLRHSASLEIQTLEVPIPITVSPATPEVENTRTDTISVDYAIVEKEGGEKDKDNKARDKEKKEFLAGLRKRSASIDQDTLDVFKPKKMGQMLKNRVHKGRAGITAVSRRIGNGVTKNGVARRSSSTPDFHAVLQQTSYQASSIHSRRRLSSIMHSDDRTPTASPPPPPPPVTSAAQQDFKLKNDRSARENRLLSELWLMSAATFRRLSKVDQAKGSIQEAEVKDENNPNVWVQVSKYPLRPFDYCSTTITAWALLRGFGVASTRHGCFPKGALHFTRRRVSHRPPRAALSRPRHHAQGGINKQTTRARGISTERRVFSNIAFHRLGGIVIGIPCQRKGLGCGRGMVLPCQSVWASGTESERTRDAFACVASR